MTNKLPITDIISETGLDKSGPFPIAPLIKGSSYKFGLLQNLYPTKSYRVAEDLMVFKSS